LLWARHRDPLIKVKLQLRRITKTMRKKTMKWKMNKRSKMEMKIRIKLIHLESKPMKGTKEKLKKQKRGLRLQILPSQLRN